MGSGSVILPGVTLEDGVAIGALSLVNKNCKAFGIYVGNPAILLKNRKRDLLDLEKENSNPVRQINNYLYGADTFFIE